MLKYAILGFVHYQPLTGYEIKQVMDSSTSYFWHARLSQIYTTMKGMEAEGLVTSAVVPQPDRPDRRVYTITAAGAEALRQWLAQPLMALEPQKDTLLLKLFFSAQLDKEVLLAHLRWQQRLHAEQARTYGSSAQAVIQEAAEQASHLYKDALLWQAIARFGESYEELYGRWLDEMVSLVQEKF